MAKHELSETVLNSPAGHVRHTDVVEAFSCDSCLARAARFIAASLHNNVAAARSKTPDWYQSEVGADVCPMDRAVKLRDMTIAACYLAEAA